MPKRTKIRKGAIVTHRKWSGLYKVNRRSGNDVFITRKGGFADVQVKLSDVRLATKTQILRAEGKTKIGGKTYDRVGYEVSKTAAREEARRLRTTGRYKSVRIVKRGFGIYLIYGRKRR